MLAPLHPAAGPSDLQRIHPRGRAKPEMERPYKAFGYPVLPALYILSACLIEILLLIYKPDYTWPGLIIVLLGVPVYYFWRTKTVRS